MGGVERDQLGDQSYGRYLVAQKGIKMVKAFAELNKERDRIKVVFPYDKESVAVMRLVPGAIFKGPPDHNPPYWLVPLDLTSARILREGRDGKLGFGEYLELGNALKKWGNRRVRKDQRLVEITEKDDAKLERLPKVLPKLAKFLTSRKYQRADVAFMARTDAINANHPGLGKTVETIGAVYEAELDGGPHLVVAPKTSLESVWLYELDRWLPEDVAVFLMSGDDSKRDREAMIGEMQELHENGEPFWLVTTPAMFMFEVDKPATKKNQEAGIVDGSTGKVKRVFQPKIPELFEIEDWVFICDEYHKAGLSNADREKGGAPKTMTGKAAVAIDQRRIFLLSGTPMGGRPIKLWAALNLLDPGRFTSKWRWADEWLEVTEDEVYVSGEAETFRSIEGVRPDRQEAFDAHIAPYMVRRTKREVAPQLPDKQIVDILCKMTKSQKKQYDAMALNAEIKIEEESLSATSILAEYMRLKQFADAHQMIKRIPAKHDEEDDKLELTPTFDSGKLPHVLELLNERGIVGTKQKDYDEAEGDSQVVIASQFSGIVDMVHRWLNEVQGIEAEKITGAVSGKKRKEIVAKFQDGDVRVIVMSTTAGGVSITLDAAEAMIILDETWVPDDQEQLEDRGHGRKLQDAKNKLNALTVYYLRSENSIEQYIEEVAKGKAITNKTILDLRREGFRAVEEADRKKSKKQKVAA